MVCGESQGDGMQDYAIALIALAVYAVATQTVGAVSAVRKDSLGMPPGASHAPDYADPAYRLDRAHLNAVEILACFAPVVVAAVLIGVSPFWVNLLVTLCLLLRLAMGWVYIRGIGRGYRGLRTNLVIVHNSLAALMLPMTIYVAVTA